MTYALKASGIATALVACVMVDDDNTTIKEFKGNTNGVINGSVTIGTSTWKGVSRKYFQTLANGTFDFFGITWTGANGPQTQFADSDGASLFCAFAGSGAGAGGNPNWLTFSSSGDHGLYVNGAGKPAIFFGGTEAAGTTTAPVDGTTKFSVGGNWRGDGVNPENAQLFYGAESGSLASEAQLDPGSFGGNDRLIAIGGSAGNGNRPAKFHIVCMFNRELTLAEMQSLHDDWFGTLFNSDVVGSGGIGTATASAPAGTASAAVVATGDVGTATTSAPAGSAANVQAALSGQLINLAGAAVASVSGITVEIRKTVPTSATPPDKVITGVSTDGSGNFGPLSLNDIGLVSGQAIWVDLKKDGSPARAGSVKVVPTYT